MSKDVKTTLKEAREAIKNKDFNTALKLCKGILKHDKENYMGLVFLGLSLQEVGPTDQAPNAFRKAIKINADNALAWIGLANFYEKAEIAGIELLEVYVKLLEIETNEKKVIEFCEKLSRLALQEELLADAVSSIYDKAIKNKDYSPLVTGEVWILLLSMIFKLKEVPKTLIEIYEEGLLYIIKSSKLATRQHYLEYLKLLYKLNRFENLIENAETMYAVYDSDVTPLEWICKVCNKLKIENNELFATICEKSQKSCNTLLQIEPKSSMGMFTKALFIHDDEPVEAHELLKEVTLLRPGLLHAWVALAACCLRLALYDEAINSLVKADKLLKSINNCNKNLRNTVDMLLVEALSRNSEQGGWEEATQLCTDLLAKNEDESRTQLLMILVRTQIHLGNFKAARETLLALKQRENIDSSKWTFLNALLFIKDQKFEQALELLQSVENPTFSEWFMELGKLYWELQLFEKSLIAYLKAAKLDPHCYLYFLYLGNYYKKFNNLDKARRCYDKAYKINQKCFEAARELSEIYQRQNNWTANSAILQSVTGGVLKSENLWAWIQLGLCLLEQGDFENAVDTLRYAVRGNPTNSHCWESLADAYMARGAHTSALKSYQRAAELAPGSLYPLLQVASIKQLLGQYAEARADYESLLVINKRYVLALKGLAETCIHQAKQHKKAQLLGLARDSAEYALDCVTIAVQQYKEFSCLWKLAGDACTLVASLPDKYCCLLVSVELEKDDAVEGNGVLERDELYALAARCYCRALAIKNNDSLLWHDLSYCYFVHGLSCDDATKANALYEKALAVAHCCVKLNPTHWQHWNLLGNVYCRKEPKNYALAQHVFIKAIECNENSAVAWCNLGTLYLVLGDVKLANKAFTQAQIADPDFVNSWIGQALIAETLGHEDAMDLFRHCTQLEPHQQGAVGYGHWVCQTLLQAPTDAVIYCIHNMHAVPVACDALTWYTENNRNDPCAWNILGILRERLGLNRSAAEAFKNAVRLSNRKTRDRAQINYGRLLFKLGNYSQAVGVYRDIREASFSSQSGLALALFKSKQFEESYNTYESTLDWLTEEELSQSDLLVALASMLYMFQDTDVAKIPLFKSTQMKPPSPFALYATLSLGLLHGDQNLAKLVLQELHKFRDDPKCLQHYAILQMYTYLLQGDYKTAIKETSKLVHRHPEQATLWLALADLLIRIRTRRPCSIHAAAPCAQVAMKFGRMTMDVTKVLCVVALSALVIGDYNGALRAAQKAVHLYPDVTEGWVVMISALTQSDKVEAFQKKLWLGKLVEYLGEHTNCSVALLEWLHQREV